MRHIFHDATREWLARADEYRQLAEVARTEAGRISYLEVAENCELIAKSCGCIRDTRRLIGDLGAGLPLSRTAGDPVDFP